MAGYLRASRKRRDTGAPTSVRRGVKSRVTPVITRLARRGDIFASRVDWYCYPPPNTSPPLDCDEGKVKRVEDPLSKARARCGERRRCEAPAASGFVPGAQGPGSSVGGATPEPAREERTRRTLGHTERAARLLEGAFASMIEENELFMPAVERLYAALQEAEASAAVLELELEAPLLRGGPLAKAEGEREHLTAD